MYYRALTQLVFILLLASTVHASPASGSNYRGWDYLARKLIKDGVPEPTVRYIYGSRKMPVFSAVPFSLDPAEPKDIYRQFTSPKKIQFALNNLRKYHTAFENAERQFGVDKYTIAAILLVETQFGQYTGSARIVNRLSRLANIAAPDNVTKNYKRLKKDDSQVKLEAVKSRARYLEETFYPEIPALIEVARRNKISVFDIKGSYAGAFGLPQFLPSSYIRFGIDGNQDGRVSLYSPPDAISSAANFLGSYGWLPDIRYEQKKKVLWNYNRSKPYVNTIINVSSKLRSLDSPRAKSR
jgi:membrane-bound lytic murein transglycosylase B